MHVIPSVLFDGVGEWIIGYTSSIYSCSKHVSAREFTTLPTDLVSFAFAKSTVSGTNPSDQ